MQIIATVTNLDSMCLLYIASLVPRLSANIQNDVELCVCGKPGYKASVLLYTRNSGYQVIITPGNEARRLRI